MLSIFIYFIFLTISFAVPIEESLEPNIEAINTYLYGEANPKWLKFINEDGKIEPNFEKEAVNITLPWEPYFNAVAQVKFYLYTRNHSDRQQILLENLPSIKYTEFDPKNPIKLIIHGWQSDDTSEMVQIIKKAYLQKSYYNVISVDWAAGASTINYYLVRHRVHQVANVVVQFIEFIVNQLNVKTSQIEIVGHSLGAHIGGLIGKKLTVGRLHVIVGLDPALPLFSYKKTTERLDKNDAEYVEVVHTAGGTLGFLDNLGTVDFYPNYGRTQPGCGIDIVRSCAHSRSYQFFAESIISENGFWSSQCGGFDEINKMNCKSTGVKHALGGDPIYMLRADGVYHLNTNKAVPFAKGS